MRSQAPSKLRAMVSDSIDRRARAVAERRERIHELRMWAATLALCAFVALWAGLFVQLATGHDPGLSNDASSAIVQSIDPEASDGSSADGVTTAAAGDVVTRQS